MILIGIGLVFITYEIFEHYQNEGTLLDPFMLLEISVFGITIPLMGYLVLRYMERLESESSKTLIDLDTSLEFSPQISQLPDWGQLTRQVTGFPARLDHTAAQRDAAAESERSHITHDLHDTLGQNIDYLRLRWQDHALALQINDNGSGFTSLTLTEGDHYGLAIMRERVQMVGGNLDIHATPGGGTTISLTLPLTEMERGGA